MTLRFSCRCVAPPSAMLRAGAAQAADGPVQDRRADRACLRFMPTPGKGSVDGGATWRSRISAARCSGQDDRGHLRRPPEQARCRRGIAGQMVSTMTASMRSPTCRLRRSRSRCKNVATREAQDRADLRRRLVRHHRQGVLADRGALDLRHLCAGACHRQRDGEAQAATAGSSSPPTTPSAMRSARHRRGRHGGGRQGARRRPRAAQQLGFLVLPAAGADLEGQGHRPRQCRRRHDQLDQAGGRVRHRQGGQQLAGLLVFITDIHSLGLKAAQGLVLTKAFYWDQNDETRAWSKRFYDRMHKDADHDPGRRLRRRRHYLKAIKAAGTDDADKVMAKMRAMPINDFMTKNGKNPRGRPRAARHVSLSRSRSRRNRKANGTCCKLIAKVPPDQSIRPLSEGGCPFASKS